MEHPLGEKMGANMSNFGRTVRDVWGFLKLRKKWWLAPLLLTLLLLSLLIVAPEGSDIAPFIYTIF